MTPTPLQRLRVATWFAGAWVRIYWPLFLIVYLAGVVCGLAIGLAPVQP